VVKGKIVSGVVQQVGKVILVWVGKVILVWVGRGGVVVGVVVEVAGVWGVVCRVGKCQAELGFGPTPPLQ
jgi:hypothetical protein